MKTQKSILTLIFALFFVVIFSSCSNEQSGKTAPDTFVENDNSPKLRHVVIFKFKETATAEDIKKVEDAFAALPAKISAIRNFEWGVNNSPENLNKGYTHCFLLTFNSEDDRKVYLPHPEHQNFGKEIGDFIQDVLVIDYWTPEQ